MCSLPTCSGKRVRTEPESLVFRGSEGDVEEAVRVIDIGRRRVPKRAPSAASSTAERQASWHLQWRALRTRASAVMSVTL